jgi:hypothetical protein
LRNFNRSADSNDSHRRRNEHDRTTGGGQSASSPHKHVLTSPPLGLAPNYDVSPDGRRFLMLKGGEQEAAPTQINVVLNWFEELKQKVPTGKK